MPQRSWLSKAKSIHDLGPHYLGPKGGEPWDDERAARYDQTGALRFADPFEIHNEGRKRQDQFLYDWFYQQDGRIQWIVELWAWRRETGGCSLSKFLMVDCARATALDGRRRALEGVFGPAAGVLWQDALDGVDVGDAPYGAWSVPTMESFLLRGIRAHGFARGDFVPGLTDANEQ